MRAQAAGISGRQTEWATPPRRLRPAANARSPHLCPFSPRRRGTRARRPRPQCCGPTSRSRRRSSNNRFCMREAAENRLVWTFMLAPMAPDPGIVTRHLTRLRRNQIRRQCCSAHPEPRCKASRVERACPEYAEGVGGQEGVGVPALLSGLRDASAPATLLRTRVVGSCAEFVYQTAHDHGDDLHPRRRPRPAQYRLGSDGDRHVEADFVACGSIQTEAAASLAGRLAPIHCECRRSSRASGPNEAAVEETFVNRDPQSTLKLGQARGVALAALALEVPGVEYAVI